MFFSHVHGKLWMADSLVLNFCGAIMICIAHWVVVYGLLCVSPIHAVHCNANIVRITWVFPKPWPAIRLQLRTDLYMLIHEACLQIIEQLIRDGNSFTLTAYFVIFRLNILFYLTRSVPSLCHGYICAAPNKSHYYYLWNDKVIGHCLRDSCCEIHV